MYGSQMALAVNDRIRVAWDDAPMGGGLDGVEVFGTVEAWLPSAERGGSLEPVVRLDHELTAAGPLPPSRDELELRGRYLTPSTRYVGQDWSGSESTVHVTLHEANPGSGSSRRIWVASNGVWSRVSL